MNDPLSGEARAAMMRALERRAEHLRKIASYPDMSNGMIITMGVGVVMTLIALLGWEFARAVFDKLVESMRDRNGVCLCNERLVLPDKNLCQECWDQCERDEAIAAVLELNDARTKGVQ